MRNFLKESLCAIGVAADDICLDNFIKYNDLLIEWNEKINLTAITEPSEVVTKHFTDSVTGEKLLEKGAKVIDVGAGAGFPSLPLKLVRDDLEVLMLDSLGKRVNFLNEVIGALSLEKISAIHARAEEVSKKDLRESFDACVSRAVARLSVLCEYCLPFVKVGGVFLAYKGPQGLEELNDAKKAISVLGGEVSELKEYNLPNSDITHTIIVIKKVRQTPLKYPRNSGKISKSPIV